PPVAPAPGRDDAAYRRHPPGLHGTIGGHFHEEPEVLPREAAPGQRGGQAGGLLRRDGLPSPWCPRTSVITSSKSARESRTKSPARGRLVAAKGTGPARNSRAQPVPRTRVAADRWKVRAASPLGGPATLIPAARRSGGRRAGAGGCGTPSARRPRGSWRPGG